MFLKSELRKSFFLEGSNMFYFISLLGFPFLNFLQWYFNFQVFPIEQLVIFGVETPRELMMYLFIGFLCITVFNTFVQSAWRVGFERFQGTLSLVLLSPIHKIKWLYTRSFVIGCMNCWVYLLVFFIFSFSINITRWEYIGVGGIFLFFSGVNWGAFLLAVFLPIREGSYLFSFFSNSQNVFTGAQTPLSVSPKNIQILGSLFPMTYTLLLLRQMILNEAITLRLMSISFFANAIIFIVTLYIYKEGLKYLYQSGSFELY